MDPDEALRMQHFLRVFTVCQSAIENGLFFFFFFKNHVLIWYEPVHEIFNNVVCATSKALDQPAHMRSLIRAFASRLNIL